MDSVLYHILMLLPLLLIAAALGIIATTLNTASKLSEKIKHKNKDQTQQQTNNKSISVDPTDLNIIKNSIFISSVLVLVIIIIALIALIAPADITLYQTAILLILLTAIVGIIILFDSYSQIKDLLPKRIRKIVKKIIIYENGAAEEREWKYEY